MICMGVRCMVISDFQHLPVMHSSVNAFIGKFIPRTQNWDAEKPLSSQRIRV